MFEPADPPRAGTVAFFDPAGAPGMVGAAQPAGTDPVVGAGLPGRPETRELALPGEDGAVVRRTVPVRVVPVAEALPLLATLPDGPAVSGATGTHPATRFWAAVAGTGLHLVARGRLLPGVSPAGFGAWRAGPFDTADIERIRSLAAAMPATARAVPVDGCSLLLPEAEYLVRAFLDVVADTLPRTPAPVP
ncbi:ATP-dependent helicase, partial [Micromonospora echinofusca]|nr:ATP-dependent helicase [Micromonospora echinofusca]